MRRGHDPACRALPETSAESYFIRRIGKFSQMVFDPQIFAGGASFFGTTPAPLPGPYPRVAVPRSRTVRAQRAATTGAHPRALRGGTSARTHTRTWPHAHTHMAAHAHAHGRTRTRTRTRGRTHTHTAGVSASGIIARQPMKLIPYGSKRPRNATVSGRFQFLRCNVGATFRQSGLRFCLR